MVNNTTRHVKVSIYDPQLGKHPTVQSWTYESQDVIKMTLIFKTLTQVVVLAFNLSTYKVEAGGSQVLGYLVIHTKKIRIRLHHIRRPCLKRKKNS